MIPFAAVSCTLRFPGEDGEWEVSLQSLSAIGFSFRLAERDLPSFPEGLKEVGICFRPIGWERECVLPASGITWTAEEGEGWRSFRAETADPVFHRLALDTMKKMNGYSRVWEEEGEAAAARLESGFDPGDAFPADGYSFLRERNGGKRAPEDWGRGMALWLPLEAPGSTEAFLAEGAEGPWRSRLGKAGLAEHPLSVLPVRGIQAGNAWCPELVPDRDTLLRIRDRTDRRGIGMGVVLPPVPDSRLEEMLQRVRGLDCEVTVNDLGTAALLKGERLTLGVLLNRRRKDPRLCRIPQPAGMDRNGTNGPHLLRMLKGMGFSRLEWETCGYPITLPGMPGTVRLPLYQINTSSRCPLRAVLEQGDRGRQLPMGPCPEHPCGDTVFLYRKGLPVMGRYTSLFGYDGEALWQKDGLERLRRMGADRILADL